MGVKSRSLDSKIVDPQSISPSGEAVGPPITYTWKGKQYTVSEGHKKSRNGKYYEGGPFFTYRIHTEVDSVQVFLKNPKDGTTYNGPIWVSLVPMNYGDHGFPDEDSSYLDPYGTTAIAAVDPANPNAETGVALGEIVRDKRVPIPGISLWRRRTEVAKAAGSEYLNAVFGWLPLVRDMKNTAQSVKDGNLILENYENASGSEVHREFVFPDESSDEYFEVGTSIPSGAGGIGNKVFNVKPVTCHREKRVRKWFSGSFTYHAASESSSFQKCLGLNSSAEKLFGVSLTPDLVWELTPWSWAVDWFSNAQEVIHNISSFELAGQVMRYGYIMEETSIVDTYSMPDDCIRDRTVSIPPITVTYTVKRRREANPFGFGIQWEDLSPTQIAITAALGITRLR